MKSLAHLPLDRLDRFVARLGGVILLAGMALTCVCALLYLAGATQSATDLLQLIHLGLVGGFASLIVALVRRVSTKHRTAH